MLKIVKKLCPLGLCMFPKILFSFKGARQTFRPQCIRIWDLQQAKCQKMTFNCRVKYFLCSHKTWSTLRTPELITQKDPFSKVDRIFQTWKNKGNFYEIRFVYKSDPILDCLHQTTAPFRFQKQAWFHQTLPGQKLFGSLHSKQRNMQGEWKFRFVLRQIFWKQGRKLLSTLLYFQALKLTVQIPNKLIFKISFAHLLCFK